eukprot:GFUD01134417.1.p1 GENE.GFUD01134417.1~~GFUD01134417.1.p1  ORF type:complete len:134 (+),score=14.18 GFUD01134417.1:152-553(+)
MSKFSCMFLCLCSITFVSALNLRKSEQTPDSRNEGSHFPSVTLVIQVPSDPVAPVFLSVTQNSSPCEYKCSEADFCTVTYTGLPRKGSSRGTCFKIPPSKGSCLVTNGRKLCTRNSCIGIPEECQDCYKVMKC